MCFRRVSPRHAPKLATMLGIQGSKGLEGEAVYILYYSMLHAAITIIIILYIIAHPRVR